VPLFPEGLHMNSAVAAQLRKAFVWAWHEGTAVWLHCISQVASGSSFGHMRAALRWQSEAQSAGPPEPEDELEEQLAAAPRKSRARGINLENLGRLGRWGASLISMSSPWLERADFVATWVRR
jgi:hypothetical protein